MQFQILLLFLKSLLVNGVYFTIRDMRMTIPMMAWITQQPRSASNTSLAEMHTLGSDRATLRYYLSSGQNRRKTEYLEIDDTGNLFLCNYSSIIQPGEVRKISSQISVEDNWNNGDVTSLEIEIYQLNQSQPDCSTFVEELCFWKTVTYRILENSGPSILGSLTNSYLPSVCRNWKLNYTIINGSQDVELIPPSIPERGWMIATKRTFDKESSNLIRNIGVKCLVSEPSLSSLDLSKLIEVHILDEDDNLPQAQEEEYHISMTSNQMHKGHTIEIKDLIFRDKDSQNLDSYQITILQDNLKMLRPECKIYHLPVLNETVLHCNILVIRNVQVPNATYSTFLQVNDTGYKYPDDTAVRVPMHFHFDEDGDPNILRKRLKPKLSLYPDKVVKVFRTAAPLARVAQPRFMNKATNFKMEQLNILPRDYDIFRITPKEGIIFVHDANKLRTASEYIGINITWTRHKSRLDFDELLIRVVNEPTKTCESVKGAVEEWTSCSSYKTFQQCTSRNVCAISTGGLPTLLNRREATRCMWRGDIHPGREVTHLYATCTPDNHTCPDGRCDSLERLNFKICPQDCTNATYSIESRNPDTGLGIDTGYGVCFCNLIGVCTCEIPKEKKKKTIEPTAGSTATLTDVPPQKTELDLNKSLDQPPLRPNLSRHVANSTASRFGVEVSSCGTLCIMGVIAGSVFLIGATAFMVICWRMDKIKKLGWADNSRNMTNDSGQSSQALTEYPSVRDQNDILPLSFNMTTCLTDTLTRNVINKFGSDPTWEFPRYQLTIEQALGEGEFGRVLKARALNIAGQTGHATVAVKTLKEDARESELKDLLSEYELLKEVIHPNVIRLLGICTSPGGPIYLIIEYALYGSLRNYLKRSRRLFNQSFSIIDNNRNNASDDYDEPKTSKITSKEIISFAWQIANGMTYLSDMKLVHRDLAARNVLVDANKVCKISDFGLTRDIYEDDAYFKKSKGRVPVKWMAPESLSDHIYTSKSDVWSYGILLWELVTLGASPYPGIAVQNLYHLLRQGYRMEQPSNCSQTLYKIMRTCWHSDPDKRPSFQKLSHCLDKLLASEIEYLDVTNGHYNKAYFCSPFELLRLEETGLHVTGSSNMNYMIRSKSYEKCGTLDKLELNNEIRSNSSSSSEKMSSPQCNAEWQGVEQGKRQEEGYETPVKYPKKLSTPSNEFPQYYADMSGKK